jgi:hypothetical protein
MRLIRVFSVAVGQYDTVGDHRRLRVTHISIACARQLRGIINVSNVVPFGLQGVQAPDRDQTTHFLNSERWRLYKLTSLSVNTHTYLILR